MLIVILLEMASEQHLAEKHPIPDWFEDLSKYHNPVSPELGVPQPNSAQVVNSMNYKKNRKKIYKKERKRKSKRKGEGETKKRKIGNNLKSRIQ